MHISPTLLRYQGPMLKALGRVAVSSIKGPDKSAQVVAPGPMLTAEAPALPNELIDKYIAWSGGDAARYRATIPPHLYPQWGFPLLSRTLQGLPYRLSGVLNQGTRVEVRGEIPRGRPLVLKARLESVDDDGFKARIHQRLYTGVTGDEDLLVSDVFAVLVHKRKSGGEKRAEEPVQWRSVGTWEAGLWDGLSFGILTGDMNPIHWVPPYAKMSGFKRQILHGFGTFARTWETLATKEHLDVKDIDVRFIKPLVLPAKVNVELGANGKSMPVRVVSGSSVFMGGTVSTG